MRRWLRYGWTRWARWHVRRTTVGLLRALRWPRRLYGRWRGPLVRIPRPPVRLELLALEERALPGETLTALLVPAWHAAADSAPADALAAPTQPQPQTTVAAATPPDGAQQEVVLATGSSADWSWLLGEHASSSGHPGQGMPLPITSAASVRDDTPPSQPSASSDDLDLSPPPTRRPTSPPPPVDNKNNGGGGGGGAPGGSSTAGIGGGNGNGGGGGGHSNLPSLPQLASTSAGATPSAARHSQQRDRGQHRDHVRRRPAAVAAGPGRPRLRAFRPRAATPTSGPRLVPPRRRHPPRRRAARLRRRRLTAA